MRKKGGMNKMHENRTMANDAVFVSRTLAKKIIDHFRPRGRVLDPSRGEGAFYGQIEGEKDWCEAGMGRNFFRYRAKADSIISNPPLSLFRQFLVHSMELSDNVYFLVTLDLVWSKAVIQDMKERGFGIREIFLVEAPSPFRQSAFQSGVVHFERGWEGDVRLTVDDGMVQGQFDFR